MYTQVSINIRILFLGSFLLLPTPFYDQAQSDNTKDKEHDTKKPATLMPTIAAVLRPLSSSKRSQHIEIQK